ncbi:tyrosine-type recombinase/integrase [Paenibacillus sp. O199]|uniref:tyrosine-type recombinase/integrase n=1 Tax=Paenibacillus sp. O199 TaxID=1643925 RepID=UPI0007BFB865|nr:tyrosine-type recombinase/integrase [Paenibacillus sp. O199]
MQLSNVIGLNNRSVYSDIRTYLKKFNSIHTQKNYERSLRNFFMWYKGKDLEVIQKDDLKVRNADVTEYQTFLKEHAADYSNITINNYIAPIQSLYEWLEINEYEVNSKYVKIASLPDDSEHCGALYLDEAEKMASIIREDKVKGIEKSTFIRLAYTTSFRKSTLLSIKYSDIRLDEKRGYYNVYVIGKKGKKHTVPISKELYYELMLIKEQKYYERYNDGKIFHLSTKTIQLMMDGLRIKMEFSPERNIKFHSLRNVAAGFGTLEEAKKHLNHSNIATTETYYRHINEDLSNSISLRMEEKIDDTILERLTKEELIELVLSQNYGTLTQIKKEAQERLLNRGEMVN